MISFYAFAHYGLWAQLLVRFGLSYVIVDDTNLGTLANFLPLLGMPFLYISWIMLIRLSTQLNEKSSHLKQELYTHGIVLILGAATVGAVYMFIPAGLIQLNANIPIPSFGILILLETLYFIFYLKGVSKPENSARGIRDFRLLLVTGQLLRVILFVLTIYFEVLLPLTIFLYFLSNIFPLIYLWRISDNYFSPIQPDDTDALVIQNLSERFKITKREQEIIEQLSLGKTNQQIADELFISLQTVKDHTHRIYKKTGVSSRMKLVRLLSK